MSSHSHIYTLSQKQTKPITATDIATVIAKDMATVIDKDMASDSHRHGYLQPPTWGRFWVTKSLKKILKKVL